MTSVTDSKAAREGGFTLAELITVLIVVGIMSAVAIPRFIDRSEFDAVGFADQAASAMRFARQQAIAQRRNVCVTVGANSSIALTVTAAFAGACAGAGPLLNPATGVAYVLLPPNRVSLADAGGAALPLTFSFNAAGVPSAAQALNVQLDNVVQRAVTVAAVTGYVQ